MRAGDGVARRVDRAALDVAEAILLRHRVGVRQIAHQKYVIERSTDSCRQRARHGAGCKDQVVI